MLFQNNYRENGNEHLTIRTRPAVSKHTNPINFFSVVKMDLSVWVLPDDLLTGIVEMLSLKDLSRMDSAICNAALRSRYLDILSHARIAMKVTMQECTKLDGSPYLAWLLLRNMRMRELVLVGQSDAFGPTAGFLSDDLTSLIWYNYCPLHSFHWPDDCSWKLNNIVSLSFHSEYPLELHHVIGHVAIRSPNLQVLKVRSVVTARYYDDYSIGSLLDLVTHCPHLHSLFLWNIQFMEISDLQLLKQLNKLIFFAEESYNGIQLVYSEEEFTKDLSRVCVLERVSIDGVNIAWKGLSTHTLGEYIAEVVPDLGLLHTSFYSDCVFALPVVRQCRNISRVVLTNCLHLTTELLLSILTLPHLYHLELENNTTLEQLIPAGGNVVSVVVTVTILRFTRLQAASVEYFVKCCPRMNRDYSQICV